MSDNNMFQKNVKGYSHVNKSLFIKQPNSEVIPFAVERQLVDNFVGLDIPVKFTDINGSLYLCGSQLIDLFDVNENHIRNHMNNIYGEYLDRNGIFTVNDVQSWGGRISAPPSFLNIYQLNVVYNRTENTINQHGGGGGSQQVLFYHHDLIMELAGRLNNNRARAISQYVKNLIHEYHKTGVVVNTTQHIDIYSAIAAIMKKHKNYTIGRLLNVVFIQGKIDQLFNMCDDRHLYTRGYFHGNIRNTLIVYATGKNAAGVLYTCSTNQEPKAGMTSHSGVNPNKKDSCIGINYLNTIEESYYGAAINTIFGNVLEFANTIRSMNNGFLSVNHVLRFSVFVLSGHPHRCIERITNNYLDYPITAIPNVILPIKMSKAKQIAIENLIYVRNSFEKKVITNQQITENEFLEYLRAGEMLVPDILEENDYAEQIIINNSNNDFIFSY